MLADIGKVEHQPLPRRSGRHRGRRPDMRDRRGDGRPAVDHGMFAEEDNFAGGASLDHSGA